MWRHRLIIAPHRRCPHHCPTAHLVSQINAIWGLGVGGSGRPVVVVGGHGCYRWQLDARAGCAFRTAFCVARRLGKMLLAGEVLWCGVSVKNSGRIIINIEALCAAPSKVLAHSPTRSQMHLSCPVAPQSQRAASCAKTANSYSIERREVHPAALDLSPEVSYGGDAPRVERGTRVPYSPERGAWRPVWHVNARLRCLRPLAVRWVGAPEGVRAGSLGRQGIAAEAPHTAAAAVATAAAAAKASAAPASAAPASASAAAAAAAAMAPVATVPLAAAPFLAAHLRDSDHTKHQKNQNPVLVSQ